MGNVAHWELALIQARQYEIELEPLLETADIRKQQIVQLPIQIESLNQELRQVLFDIEELKNAPVPVQPIIVDDTLILSNGNKTQSEISQGLQRKPTSN